MSLCLFTLQALYSSSGHPLTSRGLGQGQEEDLGKPVPVWDSAAVFERGLDQGSGMGVRHKPDPGAKLPRWADGSAPHQPSSSPCLSFLIYKMRLISVPVSEVVRKLK